jgi:fructose 1,6-bisphosphatase
MKKNMSVLAFIVLLISIGIFFPVETKTELGIKTTINEINELGNTIANMPLTKEAVADVQKLLREKKEDLKIKVNKLKSFENFQLKSEIAKDLDNCLSENPKKIVGKYEELAKRVFNDIETLTNLKKEYIGKESPSKMKKINDSTKIYGENLELLEGLQTIVNDWMEIFEGNTK